MPEPKGLFNKYTVLKDGKPIQGKYFVLRYDRDPHARRAILAYIDSVIGENRELASDLLRSLSSVVDIRDEVPY